MLSACGGSGNERPKSVSDPVIQTRTETVRVCPAELTAARPARPQPEAGAEIKGNDAGMRWLSALLRYLGLVEDRLADAAGQCAAGAR